MKKNGKLISFILAFTMCIPETSFLSSAVTIPYEIEDKVSSELNLVMAEKKENDFIPVCIWIDDIDYEKINNITLERTGLSEEKLFERSDLIYGSLDDHSIQNLKIDYSNEKNIKISNENKDFVSYVNNEDENEINSLSKFYKSHKNIISKLSDDVDIYIDAKRTAAREEYNANNAKFIDKYLSESNIIFSSQYAPMIIGEVSKKNIDNLRKLPNVDSIDLYQKRESIDDGGVSVSVPSIRGNYTRDTLGFNGYGVKIGQIENGFPKLSYPEFSNSSINRSTLTYFQTPHASIVAAIMVGEGGMAPEAQLYSTTLKDINNNDTSYENTEWLLSSDVTVINRSSSVESNGTYDNLAKWVDHIVYHHNVSWVQTPGNEGADVFVHSPGNAYNVITVGAINDNDTSNTNDDSYYNSTCRLVGNNMPEKPDVVAPGVNFSVTGEQPDSGTSFSAPHVTGMIAQMMSFMPILKLKPEAIKAAVIASCDRKVSGEAENVITIKEGAGVINALNAANSLSNVSVQHTYYTTNASSISFNFYPLSTGTKTIAISWLRRNTCSGTGHSSVSSPVFSDYDLRVYDSNGVPVASSCSLYNSTEFLKFNATSLSAYSVVITKYSGSTASDRIALAHVR